MNEYIKHESHYITNELNIIISFSNYDILKLNFNFEQTDINLFYKWGVFNNNKKHL